MSTTSLGGDPNNAPTGEVKIPTTIAIDALISIDHSSLEDDDNPRDYTPNCLYRWQTRGTALDDWQTISEDSDSPSIILGIEDISKETRASASYIVAQETMKLYIAT